MLYISKQYFKFMECICKNIRRDIHKKEIHTSGDLSGGGGGGRKCLYGHLCYHYNARRKKRHKFSLTFRLLSSIYKIVSFFFFFSTRIV